MPRELLVIGYKPDGTVQLLAGAEYSKTRAAFEKLRAAGRLPKGIATAKLFDSENGITATIHDEPSRRLAVHQSTLKATKSDVEQVAAQKSQIDTAIKALEGDIEQGEKELRSLEGKQQLAVKANKELPREEQSALVNLPDQLNQLRRSLADVQKRAEQLTGHHQAVLARHKSAKEEHDAYVEASKSE